MADGAAAQLVRISKTIPIIAIRLSMKDLASIHARLAIQVQEQANIDISALVKPPEKPQAEWDAEIKDLRDNAYRVTVAINGQDGSALTGDDASVFGAANLPDKIASIFMSNGPSFQNRIGRQPANLFGLHFDFAKPPLFEFGAAISAPTTNHTNLQIQGNRAGWIAGIQAAVQTITGERRTQRAWLHRAFTYDAGLLLFGFPLAIYTCWKISPFVTANISPMGGFATAFVYLYCAFFVIWIYRGLFGYSKWAFPVAELIDNNDASGRHRAVLGAIILALLVNVIWEIIKHV